MLSSFTAFHLLLFNPRLGGVNVLIARILSEIMPSIAKLENSRCTITVPIVAASSSLEMHTQAIVDLPDGESAYHFSSAFSGGRVRFVRMEMTPGDWRILGFVDGSWRVQIRVEGDQFLVQFLSAKSHNRPRH
jgi:hypothetical protein